MAVLPLQNRCDPFPNRLGVPGFFSRQRWRSIGCTLSILATLPFALAAASAQEGEPVGDEVHEREELGVNPYTAPSIARVFERLDALKPLPFEQLRRAAPPKPGADRAEKALIFGQLIGDGFLIVVAERKNQVEEFGRVLLRQARALGVAERVTRHSASLTDLGRRGDWPAVRKELTATQADVEQALVELRDQTIAHLISLGGWLRGLEIGTDAVAANFSAERAKILSEPDLVDYFVEELKTLPPAIAHRALIERIRAGLRAIQTLVRGAAGELSRDDVQAIRAQARELNSAIRELPGTS